MDLSVIIVNFNTKDLLRQCLNSVFKQTDGINFEVIVVDNASADGSAGMTKKEFSQAKLIKNAKNLGFAQANNQAFRQAQGEFVLLLNSDTTIKDNALAKLVKFGRSQPDLGIAGPKLLNPDTTVQASAGRFYTLPVTVISLLRGDQFLRISPDKVSRVDWVSGACFLIKKEVIERIGLLDEKFFMYVEEMEYCYRAKKAGYQTYFYPQAKVIHRVGGSSLHGWPGRQKAILGIYQGLIWFYQKHFSPWQLFVLKLLLQTKAAGAYLFGLMTGNDYLKETYAKAWQVVK